MTIEAYIASLNTMKKDLPKKVDEIILKNKNFIVGMLKFRLYNKGTDGNGAMIGRYSKKTIPIKIANSQKTSFITLRDQGHFYTGMFLESRNNEYIIDSTDRKTDLLVQIYGKSIMELTKEQQDNVVSNIIDPDIQKYLDSLSGSIEIDL